MVQKSKTSNNLIYVLKPKFNVKLIKKWKRMKRKKVRERRL